MELIVDIHEPKAIDPLLVAKLGEGVVRRPLPTGDYTFMGKEGCVVIERKAVNDLYGSFMKGRLQDQLRRCLSMSSQAFLLIEGSLKESHGFLVAGNGKRMKTPYTALSNFLVSAQAEGINILLSTSLENTASVIAGLYNYFQKETHKSMADSGTRSKVCKTLLDQQVLFLTGLPGIGEQLAKDILSVYFSPALAIQGNLEGVKGVGPKKREVAINVLYGIDKGGVSDQ